jgi:hypothetical protein
MTTQGPAAPASPPSPASTAYAVALVPVSGARAWSLAGLKAVFLATMALWGWWDELRVGDLVVTRRADGAEVLRTAAGGHSEAALLLAHVEEQLTDLTVSEFEDTWTIAAPSATGRL